MCEPPSHLIQYPYKDEIINYILDQAFIEVPLKQDLLDTAAQLFTVRECRHTFVASLEHDYKAYQLDYMNQHEIERRQVKVCLPRHIYYNLLSIFKTFLDKVMVELLDSEPSEVTKQDSKVHDAITQLLRLMLFTKLFQHVSADKRSALMLGDKLRMMQRDLAGAPIW